MIHQTPEELRVMAQRMRGEVRAPWPGKGQSESDFREEVARVLEEVAIQQQIYKSALEYADAVDAVNERA